MRRFTTVWSVWARADDREVVPTDVWPSRSLRATILLRPPPSKKREYAARAGQCQSGRFRNLKCQAIRGVESGGKNALVSFGSNFINFTAAIGRHIHVGCAVNC